MKAFRISLVDSCEQVFLHGTFCRAFLQVAMAVIFILVVRQMALFAVRRF